MKYFKYCEGFWSKWQEGNLSPSKYVSDKFRMDGLPEPYLTYGSGEDALHILSTNPGQVNCFQMHNHIKDGTSFIPNDVEYSKVSQLLAEFYRSPVFGKKSKTRIEKQLELQKLAGKDHLITLECLPYHSDSLPDKKNVIANLDDDLEEYTKSLSKYLSSKTVLYISAFSSSKDITLENVKESEWLTWVAGIMGLSIEDATITPLLEKDGSVSVALLHYKKGKTVKAISLMKGSNNLPKDLDKIAALLK